MASLEHKARTHIKRSDCIAVIDALITTYENLAALSCKEDDMSTLHYYDGKVEALSEIRRLFSRL